jgi:hypothetical protein
VAALLPLIGILPTLGDGVVKSADAPLHVHRIFAMTTLLQGGELWPRWVSWFHLGYGYPVFNFYPPGVFYLGGLLGLLGIPATVAFALISAFAWMFGSVGTYALARRFLPPTSALLAAMLWVYAPSRLYEIWHQGSLPQMLSGACVPWVFWGLIVAAQRPGRRSILAVALPLAGMILTHQPITLVAGLLIAPTAIILPSALAWRDRRTLIGRLVCVFGGLLLGAGLAGIFLFPLAGELRYVKSATQAEDVIPYLVSNFLQPGEIFAQPGATDLSDLRFELPTTLGLVGGVLALVGLSALARRKRFGLALLLAIGLAFTIFMLLEISLPAWERIPFLAQLRFPARLLRVGAVLLALAGGASLLWLPVRWRSIGLGIGLIATLVAALPLVYPNQRFVNWPNLSALDEIRMEETEHNWGTTSYDEFRPLWGQKPGWDDAVEPEEYVTNPRRIVVNRLDMIRQWPDLKVEQVDTAAVRVTVTSARPVRFRQFYFPGWTATLNGQPVEIYPEDELGQITVNVPAGEHIISLKYVGTPIQAVGAGVTMASLVITLGLFITGRRQQMAAPAPTEPLEPRVGWAVAGGVVAFALVNTLVITPHTLWFRHRSPPDQPVYMQTPARHSFGGEVELLGYTLTETSIQPGGPLPLLLFWRTPHPVTHNYRPIVQLVNLSQSAAWAASEPFFPGGGPTAGGYPPDRFASEVHKLRLFPDAPPYVGRISVQMVEAQTGQPLKLPDGSDRLILPPIIRLHTPNAAIARKLDYRFGEGIELWCATVQRGDDRLNITLGWHVTRVPAGDYVAFTHGLNTAGDKLTQFDGPPLGNDYPTSLWQPGQTLLDRRMLPFDPAIQTIALGLYTPGDGARLPATQGNQPLPDNRVLLPVTEASCPP